MEILTSQMACAVEALGKVGARPRDVAAIGITNQRETVVIWDRETGKPMHPASSGRTGGRRAFLSTRKERRRRRHPQPHRPGHRSLLLRHQDRWILDHVEGARARAERGELAFGTVDSWLIWHLTSGHRHVTDVTNASRTLLYNIVEGRVGCRVAEASSAFRAACCPTWSGRASAWAK